MTYQVQLAIYRGAAIRPHRSTRWRVRAESPLDAMARAEQKLNVLLPDDQYAAATDVFPRRDPRAAAGRAPVFAEAA